MPVVLVSSFLGSPQIARDAAAVMLLTVSMMLVVRLMLFVSGSRRAIWYWRLIVEGLWLIFRIIETKGWQSFCRRS